MASFTTRCQVTAVMTSLIVGEALCTVCTYWGLDTSWIPGSEAMGLAQNLKHVSSSNLSFFDGFPHICLSCLSDLIQNCVYMCILYALLALGLRYGDQKWSHLLQLFFFGRNHVKSCRYHLILQVDLQAPRCFFNVGLHSKFLQTGPTSYTKLVTKRDIKWYHACDSSACASASAAATHLQIALLCSCADEACVCDEVRLLPK